MAEINYVGSELELFADVDNWKSYWSRKLRPFITGDILEVGAGMGVNTPFLDPGGRGRYVCLEPDPRLIEDMQSNLGQAGGRYEIVCGTLQDIDRTPQFDTIVYIDVLEHIGDDRQELADAAARLKKNGRLVVLAPAHQQLFSPFDAAIGHFRRYNCSMLREISPARLRLERMFYLDSGGLALSAGNRLFMRKSMPTRRQLRIWDRYVVPLSRVLDLCFCGAVGKTIVAIWRANQESGE
jgi:SAM-dependent methyltransferase